MPLSTIGTNQIADGAIAVADVADGSITTAKIADNAVTTAKVDPAQTDITSVGTLTSFRSTGIDDNADGLAITIDSSENVMVGKTSTNFQTVGVEAKTNGSLHATADQNNPIVAVRKTNDGKIQAFYKDSTEVGYIGNAGARLFINSGNVGLNFAGDGSNQILPSNAGANRDGQIDLGTTNVRFKDLYLSSGVFLGGTGSANQLDDYEEGTFTPAFTNAPSSGTVSSLSGNYTKIGRLVYIQILVQGSGFAIASYARIQGLPFSASDDSNTGTYIMGSIATRGHGWTSLASGTTQLYLSTSGTVSSNNQINVSALYRAS